MRPRGWALCLAATTLVADPARALQSLVLIRAETGPGQVTLGSGVVVAPDLVATNAHVVRNALRVFVQGGGRSWEPSALCLAADRDLVLLRLSGLTLPPAEPAPPDRFREGAPVLALGYGGGAAPSPRRGRITALWTFRGDRLIQTDTRNRPGSSGGGLFTEDGLLLGITTFNLGSGGAFDFAVPVSWVLGLAQARAGALTCPLVVEDRLRMDFTDLLSEDPRNLAAWDALTRTWVETSPGEAGAWYARGTALDGRLRAHPEEPGLLEALLGAYQRATALDPTHAKAWNNLGATLDLLNRFPEAHAAFRRAVQARPDYGLAWANLGGSLLADRKYAEAAEALKESLRLQGDQTEGWGRLAFCETSLGRWGEAARHWRLALRYAPYRGEWWAELRRACQKSGDTDTAREALERMKELGVAELRP
ncbi:MAG TPA: tetratricopeptide repeat-containing serine protease family protein [Holophaga sp.]|nr:tetratricopeptide repeat-containing serine protease family protein [Holophaga sp.]